MYNLHQFFSSNSPVWFTFFVCFISIIKQQDVSVLACGLSPSEHWTNLAKLFLLAPSWSGVVFGQKILDQGSGFFGKTGSPRRSGDRDLVHESTFVGDQK